MIRGVALRLLAALALAGACSRGTPPGGASDPSSTPSPKNAPETHQNIVPKANTSDDAQAIDPPEGPPAPTVDPLAPTTTAADEAAPVAPEPRACRNNERLDSGCRCRSGGACFDICCGPNSDCAHPRTPGGPSACLLRMPPSPSPSTPPPAPECSDGESLSSGCTCTGTRCMDLCCVGSACSHHSSPDGGWAKCIRLPKRR